MATPKILQVIDKHGYGGIQQVANQLEQSLDLYKFTTYEYLTYKSNLKILKWLEIIWRLILKGREKYDVIIIHSVFILPIAPIYRAMGRKIIFCLHGPHKLKPKNIFDLVGTTRKFSLRYVNQVVLVASAQVALLPENAKERCTTINNVPKFNFFKKKQKILLKTKSEAQFYCHPARICHQKNQNFSLLIQKAIKRINPNAKLLIVGSGLASDTHMLVHACNQLRLKLEFATQISEITADADVYIINPVQCLSELSSHTNILIFPSRYEGYPLAIVEALTIGFNVISSDCETGPAEIIQKIPDNILLSTQNPLHLIEPVFDEIHAEIWANSIDQLLRSNILPNAETISILTKNLANFQEFKKKWIDVIDKVLH